LTSSLDLVERYCGSNRDNPELVLIHKEEVNLLSQLINDAHLSETQTAILALDRKGYSSIEIARELEIDLDTVYARRSEAQRKLAKLARHLSNRERKESK
jgi:DNA-binding NarL/FixJ family response regulator